MTPRLLLVVALAGAMPLAIGCKKEKPLAVTKPALQNAPAAAAKGQTEEDLRVARNVIPLSEVVSKLRAGVPKEQLLEEVRRRRIPAKIVDSNELELAANGSGRELIAAMKDGRNVITAAQEAAYMQLLTQKQPSAPKNGAAKSAPR